MGTTTKDFLSKLNEIKNEFKIFVPSLKKQVTAKPITLKQQKDIISTAVNGVCDTVLKKSLKSPSKTVSICRKGVELRRMVGMLFISSLLIGCYVKSSPRWIMTK